MNDAIQSLVEPHRIEVARMLPEYMNAEQFFQLCYALDRNPKLAAAARRNPDSLMNAIFKAAACGLLPGDAYDYCWFIPYEDHRNNSVEIQFQIGWRGMIYTLVLAGAIIKLKPQVVYDGDDFQIIEGDEESYRLVPNIRDPNRRSKEWLDDPKNIIGAYGIAQLPLPTQLTTVSQIKRYVPFGEIEAARAKSKAPDGPAWKYNYPAMARKTAVRRTCKLITNAGPTDENKRAWERFGRIIEVEKSGYHSDPDDAQPDQPDDIPLVMRPVKEIDPPGKAAGSAGKEHGAPSPLKDGSRKRRSDPPTLPPPRKVEAKPEPEPDGPISEQRLNDLVNRSLAAGMNITDVMAFVRSKYGTVDLAVITESQAKEVDHYINERGREG